MNQSQGTANVRTIIKNVLLILLGILSAAFGLKGFLLSSQLIDGGVTGISMLLSAAFGLPLAVLILVINLPFIVLGYKQMGMRFTLKSAAAIAGLSLALVFVEFPDVTHDKLLTAVFGGVFIGSGIGLAMRGGAVLDGTEIAALVVNKNYPLKVSDFILLLNILIFLSALLVLGTETALYSILTYFSASKMIDFFIQGIEQYTGVTIVSEHSEKIRQAVTENLGRGVTIYQGKRGFGKRGSTNIDIDIVFTVVTRFELPDLKKEVKLIDPNAFVFQHSIDDTEGGMVKRRPLH